MSTTTSPQRIWQAMPQGWIEFVAQGADAQASWWEDYLRSGEGWLPDDAREALTAGYQAGCEFFRDKDFDFAGIAIALGESPFVAVMCTRVMPATSAEARRRARGLHVLFPALKFGEEPRSEPFQTEDGRTGTVTTAMVREGGTPVIVAVGEIALPDDRGDVLVLGLCTDPDQRDYIGLHAAFALATTQLVPDGERPSPAAGDVEAESIA
ncbi:hypothetical protein ACFVAE_15685 [Microbacterium sp. NPDC057659]|uniref:hypothetical protein n=1 Tax=Microbacterium sp. NPDC057659 TaxID=3346198 RepID=UPI00366DAF5F